MPEVKRTVKLITKQSISKPAASPDEFPLRKWSIDVFLVGPNGEELPANCFEKVTYKLHESFNERAVQAMKTPPFSIEENGWGEFEMKIVLTPVGNPKGGDITLSHDLNFREERYETIHDNVTFRNPKPELAEKLRESGPVGAENGLSKAAPAKKKGNKNVDMEKLASGLEALGPDDLLHIVQLIHENRTDDTYTKNDVEKGEFHVDLMTLPDALIKNLWDYTASKVDVATL